MIKENLPKNPQERKSIVILDDYEYEKVRISENNGWLLDKQISVLKLDQISSEGKNNELYKKLEDEGLLNSGNVLLQNPYDWDLYTLTNSADNLLKSNALNKYMIFSRMCNILGAKHLLVKEVNLLNEGKNINVNAAGDSGGGKLAEVVGAELKTEAKFDNEWVNKLKKEILVEYTFEGNDNPDLNEAKNYLVSKHLTNDFTFSSLIENRNFKNKLKKLNLSLILTEETMDIMKIGAKITLPTWSVKSDFERITNKNEELKITVAVEF